MNNTIECILKCVLKNKRRALQKPTCLLISTEQEMEAFEIIDEDIYEEIVDYLQYIGGFTIKEAINLSFKEVIKDSLMMVYTWFGRERSSKPLYKTRIIMTIYDAVCNNRHFNKPTRSDFQAYAREALRSAKQTQQTQIYNSYIAVMKRNVICNITCI
ncbi:uncharacterized protein LOC116853729 isoform X1 [Odontomachus brunneus]|uniref:uncharacterized protein LOC116853729 isoform X1 n=1 Tax=Odontomachus brunneus TaxID=486640 RepID=UPI0013F223D6|nr:uncharacterized protein LOC116853729 isoform X1 [Odontomachus brunneus]